jgi:hypothetical protein
MSMEIPGNVFLFSALPPWDSVMGCCTKDRIIKKKLREIVLAICFDMCYSELASKILKCELCFV